MKRLRNRSLKEGTKAHY